MSRASCYQLFLTPRSPFARRIRLALSRLGLPFEEVFVDVFGDDSPVPALNPLGLVPVLGTPEGDVWFDSSVILEQLHDRTGAIWPVAPAERARVRQAAALATGLMQAAVLLFQEQTMHTPPTDFWLEEHRETIERTRAAIARSEGGLWLSEDAPTQAGWDLLVAEGYLDFRAPQIGRPETNEGWRRKLETIAAQSVAFQDSKPRSD